MAVPLTLKTAIGTYPHTRPLKDGTISSPRVCLDHVDAAAGLEPREHPDLRTLIPDAVSVEESRQPDPPRALHLRAAHHNPHPDC
jgi:hypothetical protein